MQAGGYLKHTEFIEDIDGIGSTQGPAIVFRRMVETTQYLNEVTANGITAWQDNAAPMSKAGISAGKQREWFSGALRISGWHNYAEHSTRAREQLEKLAKPFFPPAPGRDDFIADLSRTVARYAAAANTRDLLMVFDAEQRRLPHADPRFEFSAGSRTHGHIQLSGVSLLIAEPRSYTAEIWQAALARNLSPAQAFSLLGKSEAVPERTLAAWQGREATYPVLTANNPLYVNDFRLSVKLYPLNDRAAHPYEPFFLERLADKRRTSSFKHG